MHPRLPRIAGSWAPALCALPIAVSVAAFAVAAGRSVVTGLGLDYPGDAGPPIAALADGDLAGFAGRQALMGSLSLLIRAPFAALVPAGNVDAQYAVGLLPCLAVVLLAAFALRREAERRWGRAPGAGLIVVFSLLGAPALEAVVYGHPEEPLGAALIVGAVLAAVRRHGVLAGLLLGLALATKQWAAFAVLPVLLACGGFRVRALAVAAVTALALTVPLAIANRDQFGAIQQTALNSPAVGTPVSLWAPFSAIDPTGGWGGFQTRLTPPDLAVPLAKPLMVLWTLLLVAAFVRARRPREDALALLALVFLGRCALDPVDNVYYHAPFVTALLAWEALRSPRPPWLTATSTGVLALIALSMRVGPHDPSLVTVVYLAWAAALTAVVITLTLGIPHGLRRRLPLPAAGEPLLAAPALRSPTVAATRSGPAHHP
ncbi:MAG: hypothetical protein QOC64_1209 [Solirubrobacteraceae bacterium]|nr:hypothetical protein [Solirubrobacteraceae bacterium]